MITLRAPQRTDPKHPPKPRPDLRVIESQNPDLKSDLKSAVDTGQKKRSSGGLVGTLTIVLLFVCIFGVVVFQVFLVQAQSHLDDLGNQVAREESRTKALRLDAADLESPERIVQAAKDRLGMIKPPEIAYLQPGAEDDKNGQYDAGREAPPTTPTTIVAGTAGVTTSATSSRYSAPPTTWAPTKPVTTTKSATSATVKPWTPPTTTKPVTPTTVRPSTKTTTSTKTSTPTKSTTPPTVTKSR